MAGSTAQLGASNPFARIDVGEDSTPTFVDWDGDATSRAQKNVFLMMCTHIRGVCYASAQCS